MAKLWFLIYTLSLVAAQASSSNSNSGESKNIRLLYSNRNDIRLINGENPKVNSTILTAHLKSPEAAAIDFDFDDDLIFWTDLEMETIRGMKIDGPSKVPFEIVRDVMLPDGLAFDWVTKKLYWSDSDTNLIEVIQLDGKNRKVLFWEDIIQPRAVALVPSLGYIFWTDWGHNPKIERASMDGHLDSRMVVANESIFWPNGLAVDYETNRIFWVDAKLGKIECMNFDGSRREIILSGNISHPFAVTVTSNYIFWTDWSSKSIESCNKTNGQSRKKVLSLSNDFQPMDIHYFDKSRQPHLDTPCNVNNGQCTHLCLLSSVSPSGYSCSCPTGVQINPDGKSCPSRPEKVIFLAKSSEIRSISLDTPDHTPVVLQLHKIKDAIAVEYDQSDGRVYWSDSQVQKIQRSFLDGSNQEDVINSDLDQPEGLSLDWISKNLYWTDAGSSDGSNSRIEVSRADGTFRRTLISNNVNKPRAIVVNPIDGHVYWSEWDPVGKIERSNLDGSDRRIIVDHDLVWPNGLSIDFETRRLFWCDASLHKMESSNLDGSNRKVIIQDIKPHGMCYSIGVLDSWIYWTDRSFRTVERIDKSTGLSRSKIVENLPDLMALSVSSPASRSLSWANRNPCYVQNGNCSELCFYNPNKSSGRTCSCSNGFKLAPNLLDCQFDESYVYNPVTRKPPNKKQDKKSKDPCYKFGCSHRCTIVTSESSSGSSVGIAKCSCPENSILSSDDKTCVQTPICEMYQFQCLSGRPNCIPTNLVCNNVNDCQDASDESNCGSSSNLSPSSPSFPHLHNHHIISPSVFKCHPEDEFKCHQDDKCVHVTKLCDTNPDCSDNSDEQCCDTINYMCRSSKKCILTSQVCNGVRDCPEGIDEDEITCSRRRDHNHDHNLIDNNLLDPNHHHQTQTYTGLVIFFCLLVLVASIVAICIFRNKIPSQNSNNGLNCNTIATAMTTLTMSDVNRNQNKLIMLGNQGNRTGNLGGTLQELTAFNSRNSNSGSDPVYNISSNSSSAMYPIETINPPPSPVTDQSQCHYDTSNTSGSRTSRTGGARGASSGSRFNNLNKNKKWLKMKVDPPPTPAISDIYQDRYQDRNQDNSDYDLDSYGGYNQGYHYGNNDSSDSVVTYAPPPTPSQSYLPDQGNLPEHGNLSYLPETSSPPSPYTERSYNHYNYTYPNPPPSPVLSVKRDS